MPAGGMCIKKGNVPSMVLKLYTPRPTESTPPLSVLRMILHGETALLQRFAQRKHNIATLASLFPIYVDMPSLATFQILPGSYHELL